MPSRVKLLNAATGTGPTIKIGMGKDPYIIRVVGGSGGVNIDSSPDDGTTWQREWGEVGGAGVVETLAGELTNLADGTIARIKHYTKHIRATNSGSAAVVWMEMAR